MHNRAHPENGENILNISVLNSCSFIHGQNMMANEDMSQKWWCTRKWPKCRPSSGNQC